MSIQGTNDKANQMSDHHSPFQLWPFTPVPCRTARTSPWWSASEGTQARTAAVPLALPPCKLLLQQDFIPHGILS